VLNSLKIGPTPSRQDVYALSLAVLFALPACERIDRPPPPPPRVNYSAQFQTAQEAYLTADYRRALGAFELILAGDFDTRMKAEPAYWAGLCHLKFGNYPQAERRLHQASQDLTAGYMIGPALVGLADSQRLQGKKEEAKEAYNRAVDRYATFIDMPKVRTRLAAVGGNAKSVATASPPRKLPPIEPTPTPSLIPNGSFSLQAGAFYERAEAMKLVKRLQTLGHPPFLHLDNRKARVMYKVRVGIYRNKSDAQKVQQQLKVRGFDSFIVQ
jgi:cell division septation protein DedD